MRDISDHELDCNYQAALSAKKFHEANIMADEIINRKASFAGFIDHIAGIDRFPNFSEINGPKPEKSPNPENSDSGGEWGLCEYLIAFVVIIAIM